MGRKDMIRSMYKEYGMVSPREDGTMPRCETCCNYQRSSVINDADLHVCIAYGDGSYKYKWDKSCFGCGIYNYAFCALQPQRRPLVETRNGHAQVSSVNQIDDEKVVQLSLFLPNGGVGNGH